MDSFVIMAEYGAPSTGSGTEAAVTIGVRTGGGSTRVRRKGVMITAKVAATPATAGTQRGT